MSSASVLRLLESPMPGPVMPVDVAVQLYLAHSPPLRGFLSSYEDCRARNRVNTRFKQQPSPLRPCLSTRAPLPGEEPPCLEGWPGSGSKAKKKRVVFADSKGMSLTDVHLFCPGEGRAASRLQLEDLEVSTACLRITAAQSRLLDFPQPAADYLDFRSRLLRNSVCLENCTLQERTLTGTVKVRNLAFEKSVHVRVTFDSWKSHQDFQCTYMNDVYGGHDTDTFSFSVELPAYVHPKNQVEFCLSYTAGGHTYWDNYDGRNYKLVETNPKPESSTSEKKKIKNPTVFKKQLKKNHMELGRNWNGLFPDWQSWGCIQTSAPYW